MKISDCRQIMGLLLISAIFSGCATYPIAEKYRQEAREDIALKDIQQAPEKYTGLMVIWGGQILAIGNTETGSEITVLEIPLNSSEVPIVPAASAGRFLAQTSDFLDPEIFSRGKFITLAGRIARVEKRPLGNMQYVYPVINIEQLHLWHRSTVWYGYYGPYDYDAYYLYGPYWGWWWGWYDWDGYYRPYERGSRGHEGFERGEHGGPIEHERPREGPHEGPREGPREGPHEAPGGHR